MSLPAHFKISTEANNIKAHLDAWVTPRGGYVKIMANLAHMWEELLAPKPQPRVLIAYTGENARGGFDNANTLNRVDRQWAVIVVRGHGFKNLVAEADPNKEPTDTANPQQDQSEAFYDAIETIRDIIRTMQNVSEEWPVDFKSIKPMPSVAANPTANVFMDAIKIEFSTANDLPAVIEDTI